MLGKDLNARPRGASRESVYLKGAKPLDIPFHQPTKFELVINPQAAKSPRNRSTETPPARADGASLVSAARVNFPCGGHADGTAATPRLPPVASRWCACPLHRRWERRTVPPWRRCRHRRWAGSSYRRTRCRLRPDCARARRVPHRRSRSPRRSSRRWPTRSGE